MQDRLPANTSTSMEESEDMDIVKQEGPEQGPGLAVKAEPNLDTGHMDSLCSEIDSHIARFESEIALCEQHLAEGLPGHRHGTDLTQWRETYRVRYDVVEDVTPSLIFFARCALGYLCSGSISEKELRLAVIDSCKRSEVRVNNRGGLSGSQVDLSIICGVLQTIGVLDEEKKNKQARRASSASSNSLAEMSTGGMGGVTGASPMAAMAVKAEDGHPAVVTPLGGMAAPAGVGVPRAASAASLGPDAAVKREGLSVKTEWSESCLNLDSKGTTELRKGVNDALGPAGELHPAYYDPACGVDRYVLERFSSKLSDFIHGLQAKLRQAAANAAAAAASQAAMEVDLSICVPGGLDGVGGDHDLDIGMGIDINMGLDMDPSDDAGRSAAVFEMEDDSLLFDSNLPLDTLAGTGELDMLTLDDLSNHSRDDHMHIPDMHIPDMDNHMESRMETAVVTHTDSNFDAQASTEAQAEGNAVTDMDTGASIAAEMSMRSAIESNLQPSALPVLEATEEAPLAVLADLLSRKDGEPCPEGGAGPRPEVPCPPCGAAELHEDHPVAAPAAAVHVVAEMEAGSGPAPPVSVQVPPSEPMQVETVSLPVALHDRQEGFAPFSAPSQPLSDVAGGVAAEAAQQAPTHDAPEAVTDSARAEENKEELTIALPPPGPPVRLPSYTEASLVARGYKRRKVEAMCISLRHVYTNGLFFKEEFNGTPMVAASLFGVSSWDNLSGVAGSDACGRKSPASGEGGSEGPDGVPVKPKRGRRPKIRLPSALATMLPPSGLGEDGTPVASTPASVVSPAAEGTTKKSGPKNFNSNFGSRVWKMNPEMDGLFIDPPQMFYNWAEACHLSACADELEEAALRQLGGMCGVQFPVADRVAKGTSYLDPLPPMEPIERKPPPEEPPISIGIPSDPAEGPASPVAAVTPSSQSSGRRKSSAPATAPSTLTADLLMTRFKKRGNPNYALPVMSLRDNKTVQFKSPVKGKNSDSILPSTEDVMMDGEVSSYPTAVQPVMHHRKRAKSVSALSGPSTAEITARHQPLALSLFVSKEDPPTAEDFSAWENLLDEVGEKRKRDDALEEMDLLGVSAPSVHTPRDLDMLNMPAEGGIFALNSSCYHGRYMNIPDLTIRTEPMHWLTMANEFSLLGDTIVGEQSLLYSSGGENTPGGSKSGHTPNDTGSARGNESDEGEDSGDDDEGSGDELMSMDMASPSLEEGAGGSPSRRSGRQMKKSVSEVSLVSAHSSSSVVSSITGLADSFGRPIAERTHRDGVLKSKNSSKKRKYNKLTINVPVSNSGNHEGPESGRQSASTKKFAAVQSPSFREIAVMSYPSPAAVTSNTEFNALTTVTPTNGSSFFADSASSRGGDAGGIVDAHGENGEDGEDGSEDEDTSDEAFTARHEVVLEQMREKFLAIQALRKEQKEQKKKEKTGRFSTAAQNIAAHNAKRRMGRAGSIGSEGDGSVDATGRRKRSGSAATSVASTADLVVNSPRKRVPVNRDIESYVPPPRAPRRDHGVQQKVQYDSDGNLIVRKRGRPHKVAPSPGL